MDWKFLYYGKTPKTKQYLTEFQLIIKVHFSWSRLAQLGKRPPTNPAIQVRFSKKEVKRDFFCARGNIMRNLDFSKKKFLSSQIPNTPSTRQKQRTLHNLNWVKGNEAWINRSYMAWVFKRWAHDHIYPTTQFYNQPTLQPPDNTSSQT